MRNLLNRKIKLLIGLWIVSLTFCFGQTVEREKIEVAYVNSFAKNIEWPPSNKPFQILVISTNKRIAQEFNYLSKIRKVSGRSIQVTSTSSTIVPDGIDLVYASKEFNQAVISIFDQISGSNTLLVTDGVEDDRFIMINFISNPDQTLSFQINRANIINQGLKILPDMVLLGGTEVDVARLYKEAQDSVRNMESKISDLLGRMDSIGSTIDISKSVIEDQNQIIANQTNEIMEKQNLLRSQGSEMDLILSGLDSMKLLYASTETRLGNLQENIDQQSLELEEGNKILEQQREQIRKQEQEILLRQTNLDEMVDVVATQSMILYVLIGLLLMVAVMSVLIYRAYRERKRDAIKLQKQKEELSDLLNELKETQSQLVQSEKMASLGVLTAGIAHEMNNAINFIYSGIHVLHSRLSDIQPLMEKVESLNGEEGLKEKVIAINEEKAKINYSEANQVIAKMVESIQIGAKRTTEIVNGLRSFSREDSENKAQIDIHKDIDIALLLLQNRYKNNIEVVKEFGADVPIISGFPGQLGQAFLNIISNGLDAINDREEKKGGKLSIATRKKDDWVEIEIEDNGIGIPKEVLDKIFDPFFTTKNVGDGTGLGLSITYGIVEKHGGTIEVASEKNAWSRFTIRLPLE